MGRKIRVLDFGEEVPEQKWKMSKASAERRRIKFFKNMKDKDFLLKTNDYYKKKAGSDDSENPFPRY